MTSSIPRTYDERISFYKVIVNLIKDKQDLNLCVRHAPKSIINKTTNPNVNFIMDTETNQLYFRDKKRLGDKAKDSMDGEAHLMCFLENTPTCTATSIYSAIKLCPLTVLEESNTNDISYDCWREVEILKLCTRIALKNQTPNLPVYYGHFICNKTDPTTFKNTNITNFYKNQDSVDKITESLSEIRDQIDSIVRLKIFKNLQDNLKEPLEEMERILDSYYDSGKQYSKSSLLILNEICDWDLKYAISIFPNKPKAVFEWSFQVFAGMYVLHKHGVLHMDLHHGNVLATFLYVNNPPYLYYQLDDNEWYIPTNNALMKIWDFGRSCFWKNDKSLVIRKTLLTGKRYFEDFYTRNEKAIKRNLEANYEKCIPLLQSIDSFRFLVMLRKALENMPSSLEQRKYFSIAKKMESLATRDITRNLAKGNYESEGNCITLLSKFFNKYHKKPKNADLYNTTPFSL